MAEEIEWVLAVDFERVVLTQSQRRRIQSKLQLRWCSAQRQIQGRERGCQALEVVGGAAIAEVDIVGHTGTPHESFGLAADDHELDAVIGQHGAESLKRALFGRLVQASGP